MTANGFAGLEMRHLAALDAVARASSFRRGAEELGYTQSAVSQQIATLERIVGHRLIERPRGSNRISLTEAGEVLLRHGRAIIARVEAAAADLGELGRGALRVLRIGAFQSVAGTIVPEAIRRFAAEWPSVEVSLAESRSDGELLEWVKHGEVDLTFIDLANLETAKERETFETTPMLEDEFVLLVAVDSPLARAERPPELRELTSTPLIAYHTCQSVRDIETHMRARGLQPQVVLRSDDNVTVHGLVASGVGAALLPRLGADVNRDDITAFDLSGIIPPRVIGVVLHRDRLHTPAAEAFVAIARRVCEEHSRKR